MFSDSLHPDPKDVIARAEELGIQVKSITGGHVRSPRKRVG